MDTIESLRGRIEALELELRQRNEKVAELRRDRDEADRLVSQMREHLEDVAAVREKWIEVFRLERNESGGVTWNESELWEKFDALLTNHKDLLRDWNRYVGKFNAIVRPQPLGRRLEASEAQRADVMKRRKAGQSLRAIAAATSLGLSTVRTIIAGKAKVTELRRREFDKRRAAEFRARKRLRDALPKMLAEEIKEGDRLIKAAKGLGES